MSGTEPTVQNDTTAAEQTPSGRAFVIRPFGKKPNSKGETIDYNEVHAKLIAPALSKVGLTGGTTGEFVQQGNIRTDMFREILAADLVVSDISIHNANAFYELGIRHALRNQYTVMIKASKRGDEHVFDLKVDRYLPYDPDDPAASVDALVDTIRATLKSEGPDSPIFQLLPGLVSVDPSKVVVVPRAFREKVEQYASDRDGLRNLCEEVAGHPWETEGFRSIGRAQFDLGDYEGVVQTWERIRTFDPLDTEANQKLATSFQKTKQYVLSKQAAERALESKHLKDWDAAETYALIGSNEKTQWQLDWQQETDIAKKQERALISPLLEASYESYHRGFERHRSHYYSGLNAVAMRSIQIELARLHPELWALQHKNEKFAALELEERVDHVNKLVAATDLAIESSINNYPNDQWAILSRADLMLLSSPNPKKVKLFYAQAASLIVNFTSESLGRQLTIYEDLGLFADNIKAAREAVPPK